MSTLGFDSYVEPLKSYLQKYREVREDPINTCISLETMFTYSKPKSAHYKLVQCSYYTVIQPRK